MALDKSIILRLTGDSKGLQAALRDGQREVSNLIKKFQEIVPAGSALSKLGPQFAGVAAGIGVVTVATGAIAKALFDATRDLTEFSSKLSDLSAKTGLSTDSLQALGHAGSLVGVSMDEVAGAVGRMQVNIAKGSASFLDLGVSITSLRAMSPEDQFTAIGSAIAALPTPALQAKAAVEAFGRSGLQLLPLFKSDMAAATEEARRLGIVLGQDVVSAGDRLDDAATKLSSAWEAFTRKATAAIVPMDDITHILEGLGPALGTASAGFDGLAGQFARLLVLSPPLVAALEAVSRALVKDPMPKAEAAIWSKILPAGLDRPGGVIGVQADRLMLEGLKEAEALLKKDAEAAKKLQEEAKRAAEELERIGQRFTGAAAQQEMDKLATAIERAGGASAVNAKMVAVLRDEIERLKAAGAVATGVLAQFQVQALGVGRDISGLLAGGPNFAAGGVLNAAFQFGAGHTQVEVDSVLGAQRKAAEVARDWSKALQDVANAFQLLGVSANSALSKTIGGLLLGLQSAQAFTRLGRWGPGSRLGRATPGQNALATNDKLGMGIAGFQAAAGAYGSGSFLGGAASLGAFGASVGSVIPGIGTIAGGLIGGALGGILGLFGGGKKKQQQLAQQQALLAQQQAEEARARAEGLDLAIGGIGGIIANIGVGSQQSAEAQASLFSATFWQVVKDRGLVEGIEALSAPFGELKDKLEAGGFDVAGILGPIDKLMTQFEGEGVKEAVAGFDALSQTLQGMSQAGFLVESSFDAIGVSAVDAFNQATAAGLDQQAALMAIAPLLGQIQDAARKYGFTIDEGTQALIDQAKAAGIAFPTDPIDRMVAAINRLIETLGGVPTELNINTNYTTSGTPPWERPRGGGDGGGGGEDAPGDGGDGADRGFAMGGSAFFPARRGGHLIRVGEGGVGEHVTVRRAGEGGGGGPVSVSFTFNMTTQKDAYSFAQEFVKIVDREVADIGNAIRRAARR